MSLTDWERMAFYITFAGYFIAMLSYVLHLPFKNPQLASFASYSSLMGLLGNTAALILRMVIAGRPPLANGYEFILTFAWGIVFVYLWVERRYKISIMGAFVLPCAFFLLAFVVFFMSENERVMTSIQGLVDKGSEGQLNARIPDLGRLDFLEYKMIMLGFPLLTLCIISGAIWANYAWGTYWSWDPKETWSLVTWIIYAIYLHTRLMYGWKGKLSAWVAVIGFLAVLFTFFGVNYFIAGLHSYA